MPDNMKGLDTFDVGYAAAKAECGKELSEAQAQIAMQAEALDEAAAVIKDYGIHPVTMNGLITFNKAISATQATTLAYEREVENRGAVNVLERIIRGGCDLDFIEAVLEELHAANKGEVK